LGKTLGRRGMSEYTKDKLNDKEKLVKMGSMVEKSQASFSYYSMGVVYYETIV